MTEKNLRPTYDVYEMSIEGFNISVRRDDMLTYYSSTAILVPSGVIRPMYAGLNYKVQGAGPCVDGFSITANGDVYMFHIPPPSFRQQIDEIDKAVGGLIGGSVKDFEEHHSIVRSEFIGVEGYPMSMLVRMTSESSMEVFYKPGY